MNDLLVLVSSTRPTRIGPHVGQWAADSLARDWNVRTVDLAELNLPFLDEEHPPAAGRYTKPHTLAWRDTVEAADAVFIVTPEYNGFFPPSLLNAVDYLYAEWAGKPIGLVGYGFGGGSRATTALTQLLGNVKAEVVGSVGLVFGTDLSQAGDVTASPSVTDGLAGLSRTLRESLSERAAA